MGKVTKGEPFMVNTYEGYIYLSVDDITPKGFVFQSVSDVIDNFGDRCIEVKIRREKTID